MPLEGQMLMRKLSREMLVYDGSLFTSMHVFNWTAPFLKVKADQLAVHRRK